MLARAVSDLAGRARPYISGATSVAEDVLSRGTVTWRGVTRHSTETWNCLRTVASEAWTRGVARAERPVAAAFQQELEHARSVATRIAGSLPEELAGEAGIDYHDLNLWEETTRASEAFGPDIPYPSVGQDIGDIRRQIYSIANTNGVQLDNVEVFPPNTPNPQSPIPRYRIPL